MSVVTTKESQIRTVPADLSPVLSDKYALRWQHAVVCLAFVTLFLYVNLLPLRFGEVWRHASVGAWMLEHRSLPSADPLQPLAEGMRYRATSWLSQVTFAGLEAWAGGEALSGLLAISILLTSILLARVYYLQTSRKRFALLGVAAVMALWWARLGSLRPQVLGAFCLASLLWMLVSAGWTRRVGGNDEKANSESVALRWRWAAIPALMLLWANLDGSFLIGMAVLVLLAVGRAIELVRQKQTFKSVAGDAQLRGWVWLAELSFVATWIHPYGPGLWRDALRSSANPLWQASGGWMPLQLASWQGIGFVTVWAVVVWLWRRSKAEIRPAELSILVLASLAVACNAELIIWFAPLAMMFVMRHVAAVGRLQPRDSNSDATDRESANSVGEPRPMKFAFTLVCLLLVWCGFALSSISLPVIGGTPRDMARLCGPGGPRDVSESLDKQPTDRLVWAPAYWGDWLAWDRSADVQVFATSGMARLPRRVQLDYMQIYRADGDWQRALDRYNVGTLVVDRQRQKRLSAAVLRGGKNWKLVFESDEALVLTRKG